MSDEDFKIKSILIDFAEEWGEPYRFMTNDSSPSSQLLIAKDLLINETVEKLKKLKREET